MNSKDLVKKARAIEKSGGNTNELLDLLTIASKEGEAEATYALGTFYLHGKYLAKDGGRGISLIKEAAEAGWRDAMFDYAVALETGDFVDKQEDRAFQYYLGAMVLGDVKSAEEVARCLYYGIGVSANKDLFEKITDVTDWINREK